jgi:hypothetical protein
MIDVRPEPTCFLSDARGIYLPQAFANSWDTAQREQFVTGISDEDWAILEAGPDHSEYWDAWQEVCDNATVADLNGNRFFLDQTDGGLFLIPVGMTYDDEADGWRWP